MNLLYVYLVGVILTFFGSLVYLGWCDDKHELDTDLIGSCTLFSFLGAILWPVLVVLGVSFCVAAGPIKLGMWLREKTK